jgi:hypothetical protein
MKTCLSHLTEDHRQEVPKQFAEEIFVHTDSDKYRRGFMNCISHQTFFGMLQLRRKRRRWVQQKTKFCHETLKKL